MCACGGGGSPRGRTECAVESLVFALRSTWWVCSRSQFKEGRLTLEGGEVCGGP